MPTGDRFAETFAALRGVLEPYAAKMTVTVDKPGHYELASATMTDRIGRPLSCASVKTNKHYVSFHLMPLYGDASLLERVSPALKTRMQGKSCFNFTTVEAGQLRELAALTRQGVARFKNLTLPWA